MARVTSSNKRIAENGEKQQYRMYKKKLDVKKINEQPIPASVRFL